MTHYPALYDKAWYGACHALYRIMLRQPERGPADEEYYQLKLAKLLFVRGAPVMLATMKMEDSNDILLLLHKN